MADLSFIGRLLTIIISFAIGTIGSHSPQTMPNPEIPPQYENLPQIEIGFGETKDVHIRDNKKIKIKFLDVIEDSRCPKGVDCVWIGMAKLSMEIIEEGDANTYTVAIQDGYERYAMPSNMHPNNAIFLKDKTAIYAVALAPYPEFGKTNITNEDYKLTLFIDADGFKPISE
jgi:hypothetical protein